MEKWYGLRDTKFQYNAVSYHCGRFNFCFARTLYDNQYSHLASVQRVVTSGVDRHRTHTYECKNVLVTARSLLYGRRRCNLASRGELVEFSDTYERDRLDVRGGRMPDGATVTCRDLAQALLASNSHLKRIPLS